MIDEYQKFYKITELQSFRYEGEINGIRIDIPGDSKRPSIKYHHRVYEIISNQNKYINLIDSFLSATLGNKFNGTVTVISSVIFDYTEDAPTFTIYFETEIDDPYYVKSARFVGMDHVKMINVEVL